MSLVRLKEETLPFIFSKFGSRLVECEFDSNSVGQDQFMSNVVFLTVVVEQNQEIVKLPLVIKFEPFNVELRKYLKTTIQFYNEVYMYDKVLPALNRLDICEKTFAKFYHGVGKLDESDDNIVVLEDLRTSGFKLTQERAFIDHDHLFLAISQLGKFHALSYAAKTESPKEFYDLVNNLKECTWTDDNNYQGIVSKCFHRPMEYLIKQGKHVDVLQRLLNTIDNSIIKFMKNLVKPNEPMAVICHGDFCRNNILFRYSNGKPKDVKFFDIATARYSSPVVDISFFLLLNSSKNTRDAHWDELLAVYHQALSTAIPGTEVPSLEDIRKEMIEKAVYGFVHCSFFLPPMAFENPFDDLEKVMNAPQEEVAEAYARIGGEDGTLLLADMVEELLDRGCLTLDHQFLCEK